MSYIGRDIRTGAFRQLDDISSGFDGSDTTHTMQVNSTNVSVGDVNQILLSLGGVIQNPGTDFTVSGSTLTFTTAPAANTSFFAILLGSDNGGTVTPTDGSVTSGKLAYPFVVNEDGAAASDFRVESDSITHMLFVDAGNNSIGVNESSPSSYYYNDLVVNSGDEGGITIVDTSSGQSALAFGDSTSGAARYAGRVLYNHNTDTIEIGAGGNTHLKIDGNGHMTNASQPAFLALPSGVQSNIGDSTTIEFATEIFDQNLDYNNSTFTFTAPVTGRYVISGQVRIDNLDITGDPYHSLVIVTSNRAYYNLVSSNNWDADAQYFFFSLTVLADMDANDTVYLRYQENSSAADQADVSTSSYFSGYLAC